MTDDRKKRLLELYEARGDPDTFAEAKRLYEQALAGAEASDPETLVAYGYLLECHGLVRRLDADGRDFDLAEGLNDAYCEATAETRVGDSEVERAFLRAFVSSPGDFR